jgi:hypothetical protein
MTISETTIAAYVDGELSQAERRAVETAAAADPTLAAQLRAAERLRERLADAYRPVLEEPTPEAITRVLATASAREPRRRGDVRSWAAIAASWLVAGVIGAASVQALRPAAFVAGERGLEAGRGLAKDLASLPSGEVSPSGTRIVFSFRTADAYCRAFVRAQDSGVACREGRGWRLAALVQGAPRAETAYRQAASSLAAPVLAFVDAEMVGERLDASEEDAARTRGWRP